MPQFRLVPRDRADAASDIIDKAYEDLLKSHEALTKVIALMPELKAALAKAEASMKAIEDLNFDPRKPYANFYYRGTGK